MSAALHHLYDYKVIQVAHRGEGLSLKMLQNPDGRVWFSRWQDGEPVKGFLHQTFASAFVQYNAALRVHQKREDRKGQPTPPGFGEF